MLARRISELLESLDDVIDGAKRDARLLRNFPVRGTNQFRQTQQCEDHPQTGGAEDAGRPLNQGRRRSRLASRDVNEHVAVAQKRVSGFINEGHPHFLEVLGKSGADMGRHQQGWLRQALQLSRNRPDRRPVHSCLHLRHEVRLSQTDPRIKSGPAVRNLQVHYFCRKRRGLVKSAQSSRKHMFFQDAFLHGRPAKPGFVHVLSVYTFRERLQFVNKEPYRGSGGSGSPLHRLGRARRPKNAWLDNDLKAAWQPRLRSLHPFGRGRNGPGPLAERPSHGCAS